MAAPGWRAIDIAIPGTCEPDAGFLIAPPLRVPCFAIIARWACCVSSCSTTARSTGRTGYGDEWAGHPDVLRREELLRRPLRANPDRHPARPVRRRRPDATVDGDGQFGHRQWEEPEAGPGVVLPFIDDRGIRGCPFRRADGCSRPAADPRICGGGRSRVVLCRNRPGAGRAKSSACVTSRFQAAPSSKREFSAAPHCGMTAVTAVVAARLIAGMIGLRLPGPTGG